MLVGTKKWLNNQSISPLVTSVGALLGGGCHAGQASNQQLLHQKQSNLVQQT